MNMKKIVLGILAHVDAGKTTLSEGLLYLGGSIRKMGRVDHKDAFLDTDAMERERGITIFSKQAVIARDTMYLTLLDTPGHVDFSPEAERTLQALDYAVLLISGADGVTSHTKTLWGLLKKYRIPVFLFVNKMDQPGTDRTALMVEIQTALSESCICFSGEENEAFFEELAMEDEAAMEAFLENGILDTARIADMIYTRAVFPCYFGSALKLTGVEEFLLGIERYTKGKQASGAFGARVFKIARDEQKQRLTWLKITSGRLKVKDLINGQKINQIRIYSGEKYVTAEDAEAGMAVAVTGLTDTRPGEGIGTEESTYTPVLEPVLHYRVLFPDGEDASFMLPKLRQIEEEEPELHLLWNETLKEINVRLMGEVQAEILQRRIYERFGVRAEFGTGNIVYKETIADTVEGVGHFEPLRHYAEVHLLLEPGETGSGVQVAAEVSEDELSGNYRRLVVKHLEEKELVGVLTGAALTDVKITLIAGRAHLKHTEGGDFLQAAYRAVRQGLMQADSVLLEPYYEFRLELPSALVGRAMTDIEKRYGSASAPALHGGIAVLTGRAPVSCMQNYQKEVTAYTKGEGRLILTPGGYRPCHNTEEVIAAVGYDADADLCNPSGSVFCAHGAGFVVEWDRVFDYMHLEQRFWPKEGSAAEQSGGKEERIKTFRPRTGKKEESTSSDAIGTDEIDAILARTYRANSNDKKDRKKWGTGKSVITGDTAVRALKPQAAKPREEYLLVDGYNIIFAWDDLKALAKENIDGARGRLLDLMCNYQGMKRCNLIVVFDAYRVKGHKTEILDYHNIHVVYTKEAETADAFIEKFAHENGRKYQVTVATSDGLEQIIIRGQGCLLLSASELLEEQKRSEAQLRELIQEKGERLKNYVIDTEKEEKRGKTE